MAATIDITDAQLYTEMGNFIQLILGLGQDGNPIPVLQGQINRVTTPPVTTSSDAVAPALGFVMMQAMTDKRTTTNQDTFDPVAQTQGSQSNTQVKFQLDFYGPQSHGWAKIFTTLFRDPYGCAQFTVCDPLYADEAMQATLVDGEEQYEERWMVDAYVQFNPTVTVAQQSATALGVKLINVDEAYPP